MTEIQWTDRAANPFKVKGGGNFCRLITTGCANCYASLLNSRGTRFGGNGKRYGGANAPAPEMTLNIAMLQSWSRMRKEHKIFVGSMTDIFGEWVDEWMISALLDAMFQAPLQIFQLLTKRPERMAEVTQAWLNTRPLLYDQMPKNIWLGTSAEDQQRLDERLPWLIKTQAVRFLSLEPLLGPIDNFYGVDWAIVGGESGPNARPLELEWIEDIIRQCSVANIPVFIKQLGSHWAKTAGAAHSKGGEPDEWPEHLRVRMFPGEVWE